MKDRTDLLPVANFIDNSAAACKLLRHRRLFLIVKLPICSDLPKYS